MNETAGPSRRPLRIAGLAVLAIAIVGGAGYWFFLRNPGEIPAPDAEVVSEEIVADFHTSLAALDVGENEMAANRLKKSIEREPGEPALWANLAVAQMRLRQLEAAEDSLEKALSLAEDSRELAVLRAEVLESAGQNEAAIEQLRKVRAVWPENLSATFSLVTLLGGIRTDEAEAERLALLSELLQQAPDNLRARTEQARIAAALKRGEELRAAIDALLKDADKLSELARRQLTEADQAATAGDFLKAARSLLIFENVIRPTPAYQQSLAELGISTSTTMGAVGTPLRSFLVLKLPPIEAADADVNLTFDLQPVSEAAGRPDLVLAVESSDEQSPTLWTLSGQSLQTGASAELPFPGSGANASSASLCFADLNFDFQQDLILAGAEGVRIFLGQADGSFQPTDVELEEFNHAWQSVWVMDVEADGDLDLILSGGDSPLTWIRNNGDMTFTAMGEFLPATHVRNFVTGDLHGDGDVDLAVIDEAGSVSVWENLRGGRFEKMPSPFKGPQRQIAIGDIDRDGQFDLIGLSESGELQSASWNEEGRWSLSRIANWSAPLGNLNGGEVFLAVADIDNNGGVDVIASIPHQTGIWLRTAAHSWAALADPPKMRLTSIADMNGDGLLDLVGFTEAGGQIATNQSKAGYGWHVLRPQANTTPGDKRINSFGIGGRIEVRAGNLVQASAITSPKVHFGLGNHQRADVARIVWPNGSFQAEFELAAGQQMVATQRLKGSCPWVFAFDGAEFRFIKDFIWRSPLGLRINAQTTAGVIQTEDWIKIPGSQLAAKNGRYPIRITAELWETHFFDQVALIAVDSPADVEVFVDERFVPNQKQAQKVFAATKPAPFAETVDHRGNRLDEKLRSIDENYADHFALGEYQGVAEEHWVEFQLPENVSADRPVLIVGNGWIYPTDSSLNVALGQRSDWKPYGLILEQQVSPDTWRILDDNLGFPAGKNKDVLIELPAESLSVSRRFRLRTNMEIYWDALGWSHVLEEVEPRLTKLPTAVAELRHRGYSKLKPLDRRRPDTPIYEVEALEQRWLDLEGFYTRFGDVGELLEEIDDRYVIMNAGDELVFEFEADLPIPEGWKRDFILVGDGWVKDGDFNTQFSRWVRPLPSHDQTDYEGPLLPLNDDPVYQRHSDDWRIYHTRYVSPRSFRQQLWKTKPPTPSREVAQ